MSHNRDPFFIRQSAEAVVKNAQHVNVSTAALENIIENLLNTTSFLPSNNWDDHIHFYDGTEQTLHWILALDAINFSFWETPGESRWKIVYNEETYDGYQALALSLKRAVEEGFAVWNPSFLASIPEPRFRFILRGIGVIPLLHERLRNWQEIGTVLLQKFDGHFANLVKRANGSVVRFIQLVLENFPSFNDAGFYKRAQILASDVHLAFRGESFGHFQDMDALTAFADYKVPQILRHLGVLVYSETLGKKIETRELITSGSIFEVEIRAATIVAVERICEFLQKRGIYAAAYQVDGWLWQLSQALPGASHPYHLTRTMNY